MNSISASVTTMFRWLIGRFRRSLLPILLFFAIYFLVRTRVFNGAQQSNVVDSHVDDANRGVLLDPRRQQLLSYYRRPIQKLSCVPANCKLPDSTDYPLCDSKVKWLEENWYSDEFDCLLDFDVGESECSRLLYLSEVEAFCPSPLADGLNGSATVCSRQHKTNTSIELDAVAGNERQHQPAIGYLEERLDLLSVPVGARQSAGVKWIRQRVTATWSFWQQAVRSLNRKPRPPLNILVHLGLLANEKWEIGEAAFSGGPLGELVGWSDLLGALFALGHTVWISADLQQLQAFVSGVSTGRDACRSPRFAGVRLDLIYTDLVGVLDAKRAFRDHLAPLLCRIRVLDSFGTQPKYNDLVYANRHRLATAWNPNGLHAAQFLTMFPHTADNSFVGFAVFSFGKSSEAESSSVKSRVLLRDKPMALVYGKTADCWFEKGSSDHLSIVAEYFDVHATLTDVDSHRPLPDFVTNHGLVSQSEMSRLLDEARVFVGLGFPFEGPAPLEALAHGCTFINPSFAEPLGRQSHPFFQEKPTSRTLSSQHPYLARFVGEPYVYTVDVRNATQLHKLLRDLATTDKLERYTPFEFTARGYVERLEKYQSHQHHQLCPLKFSVEQEAARLARLNETLWPPARCIEYHVGQPLQSCETVCERVDRICEPSYFPIANHPRFITVLTRIACDNVVRSDDEVVYPAALLSASSPKSNVTCYTQIRPTLFSCAEHSTTLSRICPCRRYRRGKRLQTALCD